jgi:hypothetical protein
MDPRHNYSRDLRSIGQLLEKWQVNDFDLRCYGDGFHLQSGDPTPPYLTLLSVRYSRHDVRLVELRAREKRSSSLTKTKRDGLPEILRTLGHHVDNEGGRLVRICNNDPSIGNDLIRLEYENYYSQVRREEFSMASIYEYSQRMYQERFQALRSIQSA